MIPPNYHLFSWMKDYTNWYQQIMGLVTIVCLCKYIKVCLCVFILETYNIVYVTTVYIYICISYLNEIAYSIFA